MPVLLSITVGQFIFKTKVLFGSPSYAGCIFKHAYTHHHGDYDTKLKQVQLHYGHLCYTATSQLRSPWESQLFLLEISFGTEL